MRPLCFARSQHGASAIEFALVAPLVLVLLAAVVDFGLLVQSRSNMEAAASSAMSYALAKAQDIKPDTAVSYVTTVAGIAARQLIDEASVDVALNRSLLAGKNASGPYQTGQGAAANLCYCPVRGTPVTWGNPLACNAPCPDGGFAGKFLAIKVSKPYQPLFLEFGLVSNGTLTVETLAGLQ